MIYMALLPASAPRFDKGAPGGSRTACAVPNVNGSRTLIRHFIADPALHAPRLRNAQDPAALARGNPASILQPRRAFIAMPPDPPVHP